MSTTPTPAAPVGLWTRWLRFWFAPVDPTPLGFIRLVTGFAAVYVHLAYCFDLNAFFGPNGWYGLDLANRERREAPTVLPDWSSWDESPIGAHVPEYPHRKAAVMRWLRGLPATRGELEAGAKYLDRVQRLQDPVLEMDALAAVRNLSGEPAIRKAQLEQWRRADADPAKPKDYEVPHPHFLQSAPPEERAAVADEIEAFVRLLPDDPADRTYALDHLIEIGQAQRAYFLRFMRELASATPDQRNELLTYMDVWNQERKYAHTLGNPIFSIWFHVTDPTGMAVAHGCIIVVMFLFAIGFCTRVTSVLTWLAAVSYIHRTQQVLFGMDTMMNILLIYLMIGNSGAALSVDRLIARYRASRNSLRKHGQIDAATRAFLDHPPPSVSAGFALRLLQVHFCFIYMAAGLSKLKGAAWWNTNAYWDTLVNPEFTLIHYHWYDQLVRGLTSYRPFYQLAAAFGVIFTFVAEIGLPTLVWTRLRPYVVMVGFLLHAGVAVFMGLWIFSLLMMTMLLGYLPGSVFRERLFGTPTGTPRLTVRVNRKSAQQERAAALVTMADFDGQVALADGPAFAVESDGQALTGPAAVRELFARLTWLRALGWVLWVPGAAGLLARGLTAEPAAVPAKVPAAS